MKYLHLGLFTFFITAFPAFALASVTINEIAWMGDEISPNHEWIELYNSGSEAVDLNGWMLTDDNNLSIDLSGLISANSYAVLERTSDDTVSGGAFLIYTGALVNSGATLVLKDGSGQIMDQVAGGENWQNIGGDNETKETAQYTTSGWVTDTATPGYKNNQGRAVEEVGVYNDSKDSSKTKSDDKEKSGSGSSNNKSDFDILKLKAEDSVLELMVKVPDMIYVNQAVDFSVETKGVGNTIANSLRFVWNFGDTFGGEGKEVSHTYEYAGNYMMVVKAGYGERVAVLRKEVTVLPVKFSISKNADGDIQINNNSPYEVDVSGYVIKGEDNIVFPPYTFISPRGTITINKKRFGQTNNLIALYDGLGGMVASTFDALQGSAILLAKSPTDYNQVVTKSVSIKNNTVKNSVALNEQYQETQDRFGFSQAKIIEENESYSNAEEIVTLNDLEELNNNHPTKEKRENNWLYYVAFVLLLGVALLVLRRVK